MKKRSRRRKKHSKGKENNKPCSIWACTTTSMDGWVKCTAKLLRYSQCCAFFLKQPTKEKALHTYNLFWKVCSVKKILSNCSPSAPAALVCEVMSTPTAITNMKWLCVRCPRQAAHLASVKEKYFNGKHRTCESSNWKTLEERAKLKA